MSANDIKELLKATPFRPFTVSLPSDKAFVVHHPEFAYLTPNGRTLIISHADDAGVKLLDVPLITRVQVHESSAPAS